VRNIYSIAALNVRVLCSDRSALFWLLAMPRASVLGRWGF
jgi:hypothetical protein